MADFLEFRLPVRLGTRVDRVGVDNGDYVVSCGDHTIRAANVVIATGTFGRTASIPGFADQLDPGILQLHSSEYRRPAQLRPGLVLVVGASHSGQVGETGVQSGVSRPVVRVQTRPHTPYASGPQAFSGRSACLPGQLQRRTPSSVN